MSDSGSRKGTETSAFGAPGRINHDASKFYDSRLYEGIPGEQEQASDHENPVPVHVLDQLYLKSSESMDELPGSSVHLVVTSPPYNANKTYDEDLNLEEYLAMLARVWAECYRVLVPGGRICVNIANLGRKPYLPLHAFIVEQMLSIGLLMRGEIIWDKGASASTSTAWGSWRSAANPVLRDVHEYILVFSKGSFKRLRGKKVNTIAKEDFLEWTRSVWSFPAVSAKKVGHPAPFPEALPHRLIQLYTFQGDIVLDPFVGSGTTCLAAKNDERHFIGYDTCEDYLQLARERLGWD